MKTQWLGPARSQFLSFLAELQESNPEAARRALEDVEAAIERLSRHPFLGRLSRWPGLREWSLLRWRKIAVYRIAEDSLQIVAFLDVRQDLAKAEPEE